jgi:hypothetical protein
VQERLLTDFLTHTTQQPHGRSKISMADAAKVQWCFANDSYGKEDFVFYDDTVNHLIENAHTVTKSDSVKCTINDL